MLRSGVGEEEGMSLPKGFGRCGQDARVSVQSTMVSTAAAETEEVDCPCDEGVYNQCDKVQKFGSDAE